MAEINKNQEAESNQQEQPETALNIEAEEAPVAEKEKSVETALSIIEGDDKSDPILKSKWIENAKKFTVKAGKVVGRNTGPFLGTIGAMLYNIIKGAIYLPVKIVDYAVRDAMKRGGAPEIAKRLMDYKPAKKEPAKKEKK